jgi:hypothetical protein
MATAREVTIRLRPSVPAVFQQVLMRTFSTGPEEQYPGELFSTGCSHQPALSCATRGQRLDSPGGTLVPAGMIPAQLVLSGEI